MNNVISRTYEMFVRVRDFGAERAGSFAAGSLGGEQFAVVSEVVTALSGAATSQTSGESSAQQATALKTEAREALRESLRAITRTARAMALDTPGLEQKFRLPRSASDQSLINTARAFAADALPLKPEFIRHELPATFLEDLQADIADLEQAIGSQNTGRDAHVTATASIDETLARGMNAVRRLDAIVRNKFHADPATLAAWESACHITRATHAAGRASTEPMHPMTPQT